MAEAERVVRETFAALDARDIDRFRTLVRPAAEDRFLAVGTFSDRDAIPELDLLRRSGVRAADRNVACARLARRQDAAVQPPHAVPAVPAPTE
jgi:hypothetical protein